MKHSKELFSQFTSRFAVIVAVFVLLLVSCARIGSPDGGPYDETPPRIVHTSPKYGESKAKDTKIVIEFDEIIKIENPQEKVVISPPQIEQPEIEAVGKKITVTLNDTLIPNMTYTIDFADAITDNNEGNPFGDYAFTFSTGTRIDTMQVSGYVFDASNLEPIKGMLVGLYRVGALDSDELKELPDTVFTKVPFERISRSDSRGHFVVKGLEPGKYRVYALEDKNQNYVYDQPSERVAFTDRILETSSGPDIRQDTIWHDSIYYDSIITTPYTHYYPDDVMLMAFQTAKQSRFMLKSERPTLEHFTMFFTAPHDSLPKIEGLNFNAEDAFVINASEKNDTIEYWIRDSLIYNLDTLHIVMDYYATDSLGELSPKVDTLQLVSKISKAKLDKQKLQKWEEHVKEYKQQMKQEKKARKRKGDDGGDSEGESNELSDSIPPLPEEFLEYKTSATSIAPDQNIDFMFAEPLDSVDMSKLHFTTKQDSTFIPQKFIFRQVPGKIMTYRLYAEWEPDSTYYFEADTAAFVSIYGKRNEGAKRTLKVKGMDNFSTLFVVLHNADSTAHVQLLDGTDKVLKTVKAKNGKADFYFINPGTYYMRVFYDRNGNGVWDTGDYDKRLQPEPVYYYPNSLLLKAMWELTQDWNPMENSLEKQKPEKITKQKPDKEKSVKNKNAEREKLKNKANGKKGDNN